MPSHPGKEFEIEKRLDKLHDMKRFNKKNNNNDNNNNDGGGGDRNLFTPDTPGPQNKNNLFIPEVSNFNDIFNPLPEEYDLQQRLNLRLPEVDDLLQQRLNNLRGITNPNPPTRPEEVLFFANNAPNFHIPAQTSSFNPYRKTNPGSSRGVGNDLSGSQTATLTRGEKVKEKIDTQLAIDDALYELPDNPELKLRDGLIDTLGNDAEDLFQIDNITKEEEEDLVLEKIKEEYGFEDIKEAFD